MYSTFLCDVVVHLIWWKNNRILKHKIDTSVFYVEHKVLLKCCYFLVFSAIVNICNFIKMLLFSPIDKKCVQRNIFFVERTYIFVNICLFYSIVFVDIRFRFSTT